MQKPFSNLLGVVLDEQCDCRLAKIRLLLDFHCIELVVQALDLALLPATRLELRLGRFIHGRSLELENLLSVLLLTFQGGIYDLL